MNNDQLLRYSRQLLLPQIDIHGQEKLFQANVLIIGLGGLGSPAALYLAAAGAGHLTLVDFDNVELSNLQRQIIHNTHDLGRSKVESAREHLLALNPDIKVTMINKRLADNKLIAYTTKADVVLDASDNFTTRFALNQACVKTSTPLVSGAAIRMEAQISVFNQTPECPCYRCLYKDEQEPDESCSQTGILAPLVGIIGSIQATEAIKIITGIGETLKNRVLILDALNMLWRTIKLNKDPNCPTCNQFSKES